MKKIRSHKAFYFFTPSEYPHLDIMFRTLSYRELNSIALLQEEERYQEALYKACELAIIKISDKQERAYELYKLPIALIKELGTEIIELSEVTLEELEKLEESIYIYFDKQFKNKTWNCEYCRSKRLDRVRNCGFRNELNKKKDFKIWVGDKLYTSCPIYFIDKELLADAIECYNAFEKALLPDNGGLFDQTKFFYIASFMLHQKIQEEEQKELKELEKQNKGNF